MLDGGLCCSGQSRIDAAALHPALQPDATGRYFSACKQMRDALKAHLTRAMAIEHDLFLTANATAGLTIALAGLALDGVALNLSGAIYPGYAALRDFRVPLEATRPTATLTTHVDPLSGRIARPEASPGLCVVDASQSFATSRHHNEAFRADIVISGLHKHAGIAAGIGILAIRKSTDCAALRQLAAAAEQGTVALAVLSGALARCASLDEAFFNRLVLNVDGDLRRAATVCGLDVLTPDNAGLPFVCFRGQAPKDIGARCSDAGFTVKHFRDEGVVRISGHAPGRMQDPPLDMSNALVALISSLEKDGGRDVE